MNDLVTLLDAHAAELSERVHGEMIQDPFWQARYGDRANTNMRQDSVFHLRYLREALVAGSAEVLENYTRWLQDLLLARGMCSLHIAENYDRLARAITERWSPLAPPAVDLLAAAKKALSPAGGAAALVDRDADEIASTASALQHETWSHIRHLASYLVDALAFHQPERFAAHARWLDGFLGGDRVAALLESLAGAIERHAPEAHLEVRALLDTIYSTSPPLRP